MSLYNGPPRGGARGGKDQFNWESVKSDKDREFYLGHSVKALAGRWQKGKDVYWYTRDKDSGGQALEDEIRAVKQREEDAMMEALGFKPKSPKPLAPAALNEMELRALLKRGGTEEDQGVPGGQALGVPGVDTGDKAKGIGFAARAANGTLVSPKGQGMELGGTMAGVGIASISAPSVPLPGSGAVGLPGPPPLNTSAAMLAMVKAGIKLSSDQKKLLSGADRKAVKKAKKEAKHAHKAAKKASKKAKKQKKRVSDSESSSSSDDSESGGRHTKKTYDPSHRDVEASGHAKGVDSSRHLGHHDGIRQPDRSRDDHYERYASRPPRHDLPESFNDKAKASHEEGRSYDDLERRRELSGPRAKREDGYQGRGRDSERSNKSGRHDSRSRSPRRYTEDRNQAVGRGRDRSRSRDRRSMGRGDER